MSDYSISLQRLIERFCRGAMSTLKREDAPYHFDLLQIKADYIAELEAENRRFKEWFQENMELVSDVTVGKRPWLGWREDE